MQVFPIFSWNTRRRVSEHNPQRLFQLVIHKDSDSPLLASLQRLSEVQRCSQIVLDAKGTLMPEAPERGRHPVNKHWGALFFRCPELPSSKPRPPNYCMWNFTLDPRKMVCELLMQTLVPHSKLFRWVSFTLLIAPISHVCCCPENWFTKGGKRTRKIKVHFIGSGPWLPYLVDVTFILMTGRDWLPHRKKKSTLVPRAMGTGLVCSTPASQNDEKVTKNSWGWRRGPHSYHSDWEALPPSWASRSLDLLLWVFLFASPVLGRLPGHCPHHPEGRTVTSAESRDYYQE